MLAIAHKHSLSFSRVIKKGATRVYIGTKRAVYPCASAILTQVNSRVTPVTNGVKIIYFRRGYSTSKESIEEEEEFTVKNSRRKKMAIWLYFCAGLVFMMVIVGGVTRLTESGLSIVEWRPITGTVPPLNESEWELEFRKYRTSPEFHQLNPNMKIDQFKNIFWMEWFHRFLGRVVGIVFGIPFLFFATKGWIDKSLRRKLMVLFMLGGLQGFIGWWMVKSGLKEGQDHPRVSPLRLATHLGSAFIIYIGLLWTALTLHTPLQIISQSSKTSSSAPASRVIPSAIRHCAHTSAGLAFLTAMSGAIVAGLDAGLLYPEFPFMGDGLVPKEYFELSPVHKNFTQNGATAQFNHRALGTATWAFISCFWLYARRIGLPPRARLALNALFGMAQLQVILGISTLVYHLPTPLAAAHQGGSLTLLSLTVWLMYHLKYIPRI